MASRAVTVSEVLDSSPFSSYQVLVGILCFFAMLLDGFDLTIIGLAMPKIAAYLHVKPSALSVAMSSGQFGTIFGAALLGMAADRVGRKRMLVVCTLCFGVFTLLCTFITSAWQLSLFRFIGGIAMGGAIPTAIALGAEYSPTRTRATLATAMYAGVPVGAVASGLAAVYLLPNYGWQSLFVLGGIIPLAIAILMTFLLPESSIFLVRRSKGQTKIRSIVAKIAPAFAKDDDVEFCSRDARQPGVPVKHLFLEGRATTTILLWICFFLGYYLIYSELWWPTVLFKAGATVQQASLAFALINIGAGVMMVLMGRLMDKVKKPHLILQVGYFLGFLGIVAFGLFASSTFIVIGAISVFCGLFINGTGSGLVALVALSYPTDITGTAVGWAYGIGRAGGTVALLVVGLLLGLNWTVFQMYGCFAVGSLIIVGIVAVLAGRPASLRRKAASIAYG